MNSKIVTVSFLTCKRFDLFERTFQSFFNYCQDIDLIDSIFVIDDNSSEEDMLKINKLLSGQNIPSLFIHKNKNKGQAYSVNLAYSICKTDYLFNIEDDFEFIRGGNFFKDSLEIMEKHHYVKRVGLEFSSNKNDIKNINLCNNGEEYFIYEWNDGQNMWPSFSFRQSLIHVPSHLNFVGYANPNPEFSHDLSPPTTETDYAVRYCKAGFRTAFFANTFCQENSKNHRSAFELNNVNRHKEI